MCDINNFDFDSYFISMLQSSILDYIYICHIVLIIVYHIILWYPNCFLNCVIHHRIININIIYVSQPWEKSIPSLILKRSDTRDYSRGSVVVIFLRTKCDYIVNYSIHTSCADNFSSTLACITRDGKFDLAKCEKPKSYYRVTPWLAVAPEKKTRNNT